MSSGSIIASIGGEARPLCLTIDALADLDARLGTDGLERVGRRELSASDVTAVLGAGLRGAGNDITDDDLARMQVEGGLAGARDIVDRLLRKTFGDA